MQTIINPMGIGGVAGVKRESLISEVAGSINVISSQLDVLRGRLAAVSEPRNINPSQSAQPTPVECELAVQLRRLRSLEADISQITDELRI